MKKILLGLITAALLVVAGCKHDTACHIRGTVGLDQLNGKRIFLVPLYGPKTAAYVDSVVIKDGRFEFNTDTLMMAKLLMDYHYRLGVQPLLVVTEPGVIEVTIDSVSTGRGTPQNDSLQAWKQLTERHNVELTMANRAIGELKKKGDTVQAARLNDEARAIHLAYKHLTRQMAAHMEGTLLGDFLGQMYPLTYKRSMPDGTIVEYNADTNEPIQ